MKNGGKVDFSSLQSMKYLDMVTSGKWKKLYKERLAKLVKSKNILIVFIKLETTLVFINSSFRLRVKVKIVLHFSIFPEIIRLWPPNLALERICTKDYNLGKPNSNAEKDFIVSI